MRPRTLLLHAPAALSLLLWFGATFYFLGDTGKHSDDYTVLLRDRATGVIDLHVHPWTRWPYFWRPLHLAHASIVNTVSYNHPWIGHLELAIIHGLVAWMLAGLLTRLCIRRRIAWLIALLFLSCPLNAEAACWTSASCNAISTLFLLRTLELVRRQAAGPESRVRTLSVGLLAFITACWYEPAAAALAAVPLIFFAAGTGTVRSRLAPALRCTLAAAAGCFLYVCLLIATAPPKNRGGAESLITLSELAPRARNVLAAGLQAILGHRGQDVIAGSIEHGWQSLRSPMGVTLIVLAAVFSLLAVVRLLFIAPAPAAARPSAPPTRGGLLLAGLAIFLCSWIPIIAVDRQPVELRSLYVPLLGLAIMAATLANGVASLTEGASAIARRSVAVVASSATLAAALLGAVGMIGFQAQFRLNAMHDCATVAQLKSLIPDPPPKSVFLPLRVDTRGASTGHPFFDQAIHGVFDTPWSCRPIVNVAYRSNDVSSAPVPRWIHRLDAHGYSFLHLTARHAWEHCIPFIVRADGEVRLIRRLTIIPGTEPPFIIEFPRIPNAASADDTATTSLRELDRGTDHAYCITESREPARE